MEYRGSTATIYLQNPRNTTRFEVRYYDVDGAQQRFTFATYEAAKEFAQAAVREIAQNRSNFITLRGQEAYDYQQVATLLSPAGLSLMEATRVLTENLQIVGSTAQLSEAVGYFVDSQVAGGADPVRAHPTDEERVGVGIVHFNPVNALAQVVGKPAVITGGTGIRNEDDKAARSQVTSLIDVLVF